MIRYNLIILLLLIGFLKTTDAQEARLMRFPDFHKNNVVFTYAGDIYLAKRDGGTARRLTSHDGYEMFARFSPDGSKIAFTGQYDGNTEVYVMPTEGGVPKRLTFTATLGRDDVSDRMGPNNMVMSWTPDGKYVVYRSRGVSFNSFVGHLFKVPAEGGLSEQLPLATGGFNTWSEDGKKLAFNRVMREFRTWKYYKGGMADDIWLFDFDSKETTQLTDNASQDIFPMWHKGDVYFASDRDRTMNLFVYKNDTKKIEKVTQFTGYDVKFPSLGTDGIIFENEGYLYIYKFEDKELEKLSIEIQNDQIYGRKDYIDASKFINDVNISPKGKRVVFAARGDIWSVPAKNGITYNLTKTPGAHDREPAWSPNGKYLAWISDMDGEDQIYIMENKEDAEPQKLTKNSTYIFSIDWSPDSKKIAWTDQNFKLNYIDIESKKVTEVVHGKYGKIWSYNWSPDSKWLTFPETMANDMEVIQLYDVEKNNKHTVTENWYDAGAPIFSPCGKYLFFTSERDFSPTYNDVEWNYAYKNMGRIYMLPLAKSTESPFAPENDAVEVENDEDKEDKKDEDKTVKVDLDGIKDRIINLPVKPGYYWNLQPAEGKIYYVTTRSGQSKSTLKFYDLKKKEEKELGDNLSLQIAADGKKVLVHKKGKYYVEDLPSAKLKPENKVDVSKMEFWVDKHAEWKQIYTESWRQMREFFYAENMHGVDWKAMHEKYAKLLPYVNHRNDLNYLIGELIGEINIGHAYVNGGDRPDVERIKTGLLGAQISKHKTGYFKVDRILEGENWRKEARSPFTEPGVDVSEGDYIVAVDGQNVKNEHDIYKLLSGKANQIVELKVNEKPSASGAKKVLVKTTDDEAELYYYNWVQTNIEKVNKATDGQVGYIHIPDMGPNGLNEFVKHFYPQLSKKALIIDDRGNGGGNVSPMIMERLRRELVFYNMRRNQKAVMPNPNQIMAGPKVLLINNYSASDGDLFPYRFKMHEEGPIIGVRSWGGVVGITGSLPFIDGGQLRKPEFAPFSKDGKKFIIEGHGVDPDIVIDNDPYKEYMGEDAQLQKAIEVVLKKLEENPVKTPDIPSLPDKSK